MKRRELLRVSGMPAPRFELLQHRRQLPWAMSRNAGGRPDYTPRQAVLLRLMRELNDAGIPASAACKIVGSSIGVARRVSRDLSSLE